MNTEFYSLGTRSSITISAASLSFVLLASGIFLGLKAAEASPRAKSAPVPASAPIKELKATAGTLKPAPGETKPSKPNPSKVKLSPEKKTRESIGNSRPRAVKKSILVPPPPPNIPSFLPAGSMDLEVGAGIEFLSLDDLKLKKESVSKRLETARADLQDQKSIVAEHNRKAGTFVGLYEEGVVSKKELLTEQKEAARAGRDLEREELKVTELERLETRIQERMDALEKRRARTKAPAPIRKKAK